MRSAHVNGQKGKEGPLTIPLEDLTDGSQGGRQTARRDRTFCCLLFFVQKKKEKEKYLPGGYGAPLLLGTSM